MYGKLFLLKQHSSIELQSNKNKLGSQKIQSNSNVWTDKVEFIMIITMVNEL